MAKYEHKVYKMASFYLPEGWYTVEQLEALVTAHKQRQERAQAQLNHTMKEVKKCPTSNN